MLELIAESRIVEVCSFGGLRLVSILYHTCISRICESLVSLNHKLTEPFSEISVGVLKLESWFLLI